MKQPGDFSGVIGELVVGRWHDPHTGVKQTIPVESIVIADTLDGSEAELVHRVHPGKSLCVVSDQWTRAALGERVFRALQPLGNVKEFVWERPRITHDGLDELMAGAGHAQVVIAIVSCALNIPTASPQFEPTPPSPVDLKRSRRDFIVETYRRCDGSITRTARELAVSRNTIYRELRRIGIHKSKSDNSV